MRKPSWTVRANAEPAYDKNRSPDKSLVGGLVGGTGFTFAALPNNPALFYVLFKTDFEAGGVLNKDHRLGLRGNETGCF